MPEEMVEKYPQLANFHYSIDACFAFKYTGELPLLPAVLDDDNGDGGTDDSFEKRPISDTRSSIRCRPECHQRVYKHIFQGLDSL